MAAGPEVQGRARRSSAWKLPWAWEGRRRPRPEVWTVLVPGLGPRWGAAAPHEAREGPPQPGAGGRAGGRRSGTGRAPDRNPKWAAPVACEGRPPRLRKPLPAGHSSTAPKSPPLWRGPLLLFSPSSKFIRAPFPIYLVSQLATRPRSPQPLKSTLTHSPLQPLLARFGPLPPRQRPPHQIDP